MTAYRKLNSSVKPNRRYGFKRRCLSLFGRFIFLSVIAITLLLTIGLLYIYATYPPHASCTIKWTFDSNCTYINYKIANQIISWNDADCGTGMKCLYSLSSHNASLILGSHKTPKWHFTDSFYFAFAPDNSTCYVEGVSSSDSWFALLDFGVNYCNLHNVITGSGIDTLDGYTEFTENSVCTLYTSRNCDKY
ncbi:uncharacterized protein LOC106872845 [Octopus bimaculoides]|uniref:Uncharacterized protein n=1 Tax=Octopus bimaculoides TaxID=37653 RepID=A0A0L8IDC1_OCTBM|nr:uncharacterized protein LOC106872845 [Octopus bimaculoides]|eukprot:XP_014775467.1 PREDICTED: uncharacterized protein LOC106872845 [Octopus bimaculoides]